MHRVHLGLRSRAWDKTRKDPGPDKDGRGTACKDPGGSGMTRVSEITEHWFGLCRKPPAIHALQPGIGTPPEFAHEGHPNGGGGGSGTIHRGIGSALSGMRTLNRNRQLLWFTLLAGLVLAGNTIGQSAFYYIEVNLHMQLDRIVWQFLIE